MNDKNNRFITTSQMITIVASTVIGSEALYTPRYMIEYGKQDGWMIAGLGAAYPLFIVLMSSFLCSKYPDDNILTLSKKCLGKFFGSILNALFLIVMLFYTTIRCNQLSNLLRVYIVYYLSSKNVILAIVLLAAYAGFKGLKTLSRSNQILFFITLPIVIAPVGALSFGNILNIQPILKTSPSNLFINILHSFDNYFGIEVILLFYPHLIKGNEIKKAGIISTIICAGVIVWFTFVVIFYDGIDVAPKFLWPVMGTVKALNLRAIKNFTLIFLIFWVIVSLKCIANSYFSTAYILKEFYSKFNISSLTIFMIPLIYFISIQYGNEVMSREVSGKVIPVLIAFNIIFVSLIALLVKVKKAKTNENP